METLSRKKVALLVVDIQYDFLETGTLPVPEASAILPNVQQLITFAESYQGLIVATQDWHPSNHTSFAVNHVGKQPFDIVQLTYDGLPSTQLLWPTHCVQGSPGAELLQEIKSHATITVQKGTNPGIDSYSGFADNHYHGITSLAKHLYQNDINTVIVCGLAVDYCVKMTCLDAVKFGFNTLLVQDATKPVVPEDLASALDTLRSKGVTIIPSTAHFISNPQQYLA